MEYRIHVAILGWLNITFSFLMIFLGLFGVVFLLGIGAVTEDDEAMRILGFIGCAGACFLTALAVPGLVAGYGLLKGRRWGRILGIVVAVLDLFNVPIGTAFGIYGLWVLTEERAAGHFSAAAAGGGD